MLSCFKEQQLLKVKIMMFTLFLDCLAEDKWLDFALRDRKAALCELSGYPKIRGET